MISASVDPGSRWVAVTITADDAAGKPLRLIAARAFEVGEWIDFPTPQTRRRKDRVAPDGTVTPGAEYTIAHELARPVTPQDRHRVADAVATYIIGHGAEALNVENVEHVFGDTAQAARRMASNLLASAKIAERAVARWQAAREGCGLLAPVRYEMVATWRARLAPIVRAEMAALGQPVEGVAIKGKGKALDCIFAALVDAWPGASAWPAQHVEHIRDALGLALYCTLPQLPRAPRRERSGARPVRVKGPRKPRGPVTALDRAKRRLRSEGWARRVRIRDARAAAGCVCGKRHRKTCALFVSRVGAKVSAAVDRAASGAPRGVDPAAWLAYLGGGR